MNAIRSVGGWVKRSSLLWRWVFNFDRAIRFKTDKSWNEEVKDAVRTLRSDGIIVQGAKAVFKDRSILLLDKIISIVNDRIQEGDIREIVSSRQSGSDRKEFHFQLYGPEFVTESEFIEIATEERLLDLVNGYMGMYSYLRSVDVWLNFPTAGGPKETQLWHCDDDDLMNMKVLIYLNDVGDGGGPFCYVPGTHPIGKRKISVRVDRSGRISDEDMASAIPVAEWKICTGDAKTVILADTCGYHKGLKPVNEHRLVLALQYTSGRPRYPRPFVLRTSGGIKLGEKEKYALFTTKCKV